MILFLKWEANINYNQMAKKTIQQLIAKNRIDEAIKILSAATEQDTQLHGDVLLLSSRYQKYKREVDTTLLSEEKNIQ